jgi:sulfate adenylyltransferase subunit 2
MRTQTFHEVPPAADAPDELDHLDVLESETIHIVREVAGQFERPVLLFSGGKGSLVMLHLALKAFRPAPMPFRLLHLDTGHNFPEVLAHRDAIVEHHRLDLLVVPVREYADADPLRERPAGSRDPLRTFPLADVLRRGRHNAALEGTRRDADTGRAAPRVFSPRGDSQPEHHEQRPELWSLYNSRHRAGEHMRVLPLAHWTELDVWHYVDREGIELPDVYYAHERRVVPRAGRWLAAGDHAPRGSEPVEKRLVRYRTVGDMSCTEAVESAAVTVTEVIDEITSPRTGEPGPTRADAGLPAAGVENREREAYCS